MTITFLLFGENYTCYSTQRFVTFLYLNSTLYFADERLKAKKLKRWHKMCMCEQFSQYHLGLDTLWVVVMDQETNFLNIEQTRISMFEHQTDINLFISKRSNFEGMSNRHQTFRLHWKSPFLFSVDFFKLRKDQSILIIKIVISSIASYV